jgi:CpXC protein
MSSPRKLSLACPACGKPGEFVAWNSLNSTLNPHERTGLLNRSLTQFTCSACGHQAQVMYPLLYHDMTGSYMVWMVPPSPQGQTEQPERLPPEMLQKLGDKYRYRQVGNLNELIEKILIFDAKLDDRIIELAKLVAASKLPPEKTGGNIFFSGVEGEGESATLNFAVLQNEPAGNFGFSVSRDATCRTLSADFEAALKTQPAGPWPRVDEKFARGMLKGSG